MPKKGGKSKKRSEQYTPRDDENGNNDREVKETVTPGEPEVTPGGERTIIEAAINGHWVLLDNIHLCLELLPNIQQLVASMAAMHFGFQNNINIATKRVFELEQQKHYQLQNAQNNGEDNIGDPEEESFARQDRNKEQRNRRDQQAMMDFPEGRANFADSD